MCMGCLLKQSMAQPEPGYVRFEVEPGHKFYPLVKAASEKFSEEAKQYPRICHCPFGVGYQVVHYHAQDPNNRDPFFDTPYTRCVDCSKKCAYRLEQESQCRKTFLDLKDLDFDETDLRAKRLVNAGWEWRRPDEKPYLKHTPYKKQRI